MLTSSSSASSTPTPTPTTVITPTTTPESNNSNDDIKKLKKNLRRQIRTSLQTLTPSTLSSQSSTVWTRLFALPEYETADSVGLFLSMPHGEIDTREACRRVLTDGKTLYVPRVGLDFENPTMVMTRVAAAGDDGIHGCGGAMPYDDWPRNRWGIPEAPHRTSGSNGDEEPYPVAQPGDIDLLVVPGLAFDRSGARLGQGKGYYDRFISDITTTTTTAVVRKEGEEEEEGRGEDTGRRPILVAVGLEPSFVDGDRIPMAEYDVSMDRLIVPHRETMFFHHNR